MPKTSSASGGASAFGRTHLLVVGGALFVLLLGSNLPTPLYAVYERRFGFPGLVLTLIFATYAVVLIPSLILFGQLSDRFGRKPVILGGLTLSALGLALFAGARSPWWLFLARGIQGLAVGATTGAATAALVEVEPTGDRRRAALVAVLGATGGCAVGPLLAGALAQWAPDPRLLCFLVGIGATALEALGVWWVPEPHPPGGRWRIRKPSVPAFARARFARAALTGAMVWAVGALFLSVVPSYAGQLLDTRDLALLGAITAVMLATACLTQGASLRGGLSAAVAQPVGLASLVVGLAALLLAFPLHSFGLVLAGAVLAGAGLGLGFFGAQEEINELAPDENRGEVTSAFFTCVYVGVALSAVGVGILTESLPLSGAVATVGAVVGTVSVVAIGWHVWARGARRRAGTPPGERGGEAGEEADRR